MKVSISAAATALVALAVAATAGAALAREDEDGTAATRTPATGHRHDARMGEMHAQMHDPMSERRHGRMPSARPQGGHRHEGHERREPGAGHGRGEAHGDGCPMHAAPTAATR